MTRTLALAVLAALLAVTAASAQDKPAPPMRYKVVTVDELSLADGEAIKVDDSQALFPVEGRPQGKFYIVVKLSRELPDKVCTDVKGFDVKLTYGTTAPVLPSAVAAMKRDIDGDNPTYPVADKKRWVSEQYYFSVAPGQTAWEVTVNGQAAVKVADFYVTLLVRCADDVTGRIKLPNGTQPVINQYRTEKYLFPAGAYDLVLEVRGKGKFALPWKKYDKGETYYVAVVGDARSGPMIPSDTLRKSLPKINKAWQMFHTKKGVGGGAYNIASAAAPVHVNIDFGDEKAGTQGGIARCEVDRIQFKYEDEDAGGKKSKSKGARVIEIGELYNNNWKIVPWEKADLVDISDDAKKVVGETTCGRFVVRSTSSSPSTWSEDGLLQKGVIYDKDQGSFQCDAKKFGELIAIWGEATK